MNETPLPFDKPDAGEEPRPLASPSRASVERDGAPSSRRAERAARNARLQASARSSLLAEGSRFGGYLIGPTIGEGGMARVYRAEHEGLQRQVALKVLLDGLGKDANGHERFLREARIAAAIKHPNVVNIFDVGVHQGKPYLVMELLEGRDLEAFVEQEGSVPEPTLMDVIIPIVAGLTAVHDAGIVHRDLKPGNIFLTRGRNDEIEPKLLDFGISKSFSHGRKLTSSKGLLMGTPFYMSPEASQGLDITPLADQYALGVVLYECATGANPFSGANTFAEVVRQVLTGQYPAVSSKNPRLSKRLVAIIERAMHLDPARRFPSMRAMGRELLLLAGQRTRVTWGLSFNEVAGGALARTANTPAGAVVRRTAKSPRFQRRYALSAALLGLAVLGSAWVSLAPGRPAGGALATSTPPAVDANAVSALGLRPRAIAAPAVVPAPPVVAAPAPEQALPASIKPDHEPVPEPAVSAPSLADWSERPPELAIAAKPSRSSAKQASSRKPARTRAARAQPATSSKPLVEDVAEPDWVVSNGKRTNSHLGPAHGTNNAPILE